MEKNSNISKKKNYTYSTTEDRLLAVKLTAAQLKIPMNAFIDMSIDNMLRAYDERKK